MSVFEFMIAAGIRGVLCRNDEVLAVDDRICARAGMAPNAIAPQMIVATNADYVSSSLTSLLVAVVGRRVRAGWTDRLPSVPALFLRSQRSRSLHRCDRLTAVQAVCRRRLRFLRED